jgi:hypothetical protein
MRPVRIVPLSGLYLSLAEREEIAILKASGWGVVRFRSGPDRAGPATARAETASRQGLRSSASRAVSGVRPAVRRASCSWVSSLACESPRSDEASGI